MEEKHQVTLTLYHTIPTFNDPEKEGFGKNCGKEENAAFSPFTTSFLPFQKQFQVLSHIYFVVCKCFRFGLV